MPGDYSDAEVQSMDPTDVLDAAMRGWKRIETVELPREDARGEVKLPSAVRTNVWAENAKADGKEEFDFTAPSGQVCRLRKLTPEMLLPLGILDRVTRLEGLADNLVQQAEGQPPTVSEMPSQEDFELLLETLNLLVPIAVAQPRIYANNDKDAPEGSIRVYHIELNDRVAIMERSLKGLAKLDRFRNA